MSIKIVTKKMYTCIVCLTCLLFFFSISPLRYCTITKHVLHLHVQCMYNFSVHCAAGIIYVCKKIILLRNFITGMDALVNFD